MRYNPLKDIAAIRCGSIANPRTSVRIRYRPQNPLIQCDVDIIRINNAITEGIGNNVGSTAL